MNITTISQFNQELSRFFDHKLHARFYGMSGGTNLLQLKSCEKMYNKGEKSFRYHDGYRFQKQNIKDCNLIATLSPVKVYFEKEVYSHKKKRIVPITNKDTDNTQVNMITIDLDNTSMTSIDECYSYLKNIGYRPHLISQTSENNFHVSYLLETTTKSKTLKQMILNKAKRISEIIGGDPSQTNFEFIKVAGSISKNKYKVKSKLFIDDRSQLMPDTHFARVLGEENFQMPDNPKIIGEIKPLPEEKKSGKGKVKNVAINPGIMMKIAKKLREAGYPNFKNTTDKKLAGYITKELTKLNIGESTAFNQTSIANRFNISRNTAISIICWLRENGFIEKVYQVYMPDRQKKLNVWKTGPQLEIPRERKVWTPDKLAEEKPLETGTRFENLPFWVSSLKNQGYEREEIVETVYSYHNGKTNREGFRKEVDRLINNYHTNKPIKNYNSSSVLVDSAEIKQEAKVKNIQFQDVGLPYKLVKVKNNRSTQLGGRRIFWVNEENLYLKAHKDLSMGFPKDNLPQPYLYELVKKYPD